ncbi:hypothetical protein ACIRPK_35295 [Kitasatospora sp. NPDC101801]|uniref:hypothetical protein n=1 Tax=Kitasatospora sp. NPDC101801 TaxID=3364103 RepID=UPI0037F6AE01
MRCIPHVLDGNVLNASALADGTLIEGRSMTVYTTEDTTPEQAHALCLKITDIGYGTGGQHQVSLLSVGNGYILYMSLPGGQACAKMR